MDLNVRGLAAAASGTDRLLLAEIGFALPPGSLTLVLGASGAGKSTLLEKLAGLEEPAAGEIRYGGASLWIRGKRNARLPAAAGLVFQHPDRQLFASSVRDELAYSLRPLRLPREEADRRIRRALADAGLPDSDAFLGQPPLTLSGGQKRRVALASTLVLEPAWLLLDEPTAGLDPDGIAQLADELARRAAAGTGIVLATHEPEPFLPAAGQVLLLSGGRQAFFGTREELYARPEALRHAGVGLPPGLALAERLAARGYALPAGPLAPERLAAELARQLAQPSAPAAPGAPSAQAQPSASAAPGAPSAQAQPSASTAPAAPSAQAQPSASAAPAAPPAQAQPSASAGAFARRDPRALWVLLLALTFGVWAQREWTGLLLAAGLTALLIGLSRVPLRTLAKASAPAAAFLALTVAFAGLTFPPAGPEALLPLRVGFAPAAAAETLLRLSRLYLLLLLWLLLPFSVSHLRLQRALQQTLGGLRHPRLREAAEALSLAASLILRFVPLILAEWQRFVKMTRARTRAAGRPGSVRLRDLAPLVIPFLVSLLQLAEQSSLALEARGYALGRGRRTSAFRLTITREDVWWMLGGGLAGLLLLLYARLID
ncbi:hypothetical protein J31TS4_36390 [Paenibacillus sp. J31TS4]|uniref:ATP-binding cassette domain-containing protein n=1 Tax=Paenibacillus sp. J31TS4 TaxID=2807195 RepID=UPI001B1F3E78|nr:ATP-binding cassette domain-containing protein [Paenibacillus sp. J31TS4]GIP40359.1 hypothetical protein J31TS4_36390 [Paenibacillus sp. J31TS4]